jgi:hypothetical protein
MNVKGEGRERDVCIYIFIYIYTYIYLIFSVSHDTLRANNIYDFSQNLFDI